MIITIIKESVSCVTSMKTNAARYSRRFLRGNMVFLCSAFYEGSRISTLQAEVPELGGHLSEMISFVVLPNLSGEAGPLSGSSSIHS
jgi:hypothetical protein